MEYITPEGANRKISRVTKITADCAAMVVRVDVALRWPGDLRKVRDSANYSRGWLMSRSKRVLLAVSFLSLITLYGCQELVPHDTSSLLFPGLRRSEVFGFLAGFGTTFAALPDFVAMLRRRSRLGMNPRMAAITAVFQILWLYYGLLIASRPVIMWNAVAVLINSLCVGAYLHFARKEKGIREDANKTVTTLSQNLATKTKKASRS